MDIVIDASDLTAFARELRVAPTIVTDETTIAMNRSVIEVERRAKQVVPTDTHHLQRSITHAVIPRVGIEVVGRVGTNVPYGQKVEEGTPAGGPMPAKGELLGWMARHNIAARVEFLIRRKIAVKGIPARPYLSRALAELRPQIEREFAQVVPRIARRLGFR